MKYQVWKGDPFQQPVPGEGLTVFYKEEDGYWWMRTPDSAGWIILNNIEPDIFGAALEDLVRRVNLAEGELDTAREAIQRYLEAAEALREFVPRVPIPVPTSPEAPKSLTPDLIPSSVEDTDDIPL